MPALAATNDFFLLSLLHPFISHFTLPPPATVHWLFHMALLSFQRGTASSCTVQPLSEIMWILNHTPHEQSTRGCLVHHERCTRKENICNTDRPPCSDMRWCQQEIKVSSKTNNVSATHSEIDTCVQTSEGYSCVGFFAALPFQFSLTENILFLAKL